MAKKLSAIVIGCGNMGIKRINSLKDSSEAQLVAVVDQDANRARTIAKKYEVNFYGDPYQAMKKIKPDFVIVSTPNKFHAPLAKAALQSGIHVICEKPLARNPREALTMVRAANESKAFLKTGSNLRYFPSVIKAKELLDRHEIGDILFLRGWIGNSGWHLRNSWNSWFVDPDLAGGGTLLDNGSHMFDLVRWFLGEVQDCIGLAETKYWRVEPLEDIGFCIFKSVNGKLAFIQSSWIDWTGYMYMEIYGTDGYIRIDNRANSCITTLGKKDGGKNTFDYSLLPVTSYKLELDDFIKCIKNEVQPSPSGFDGMRAVQMAFGIYESAKTSKKVVIYGEDEKKLLELYENENPNL